MPQTPKRRFVILACIAMLLLLPFIAMQFSANVNWSTMDFVVAAILLFSLGIILELILIFAKHNVLRSILIVLLLLFFVLIWLELAVGIFGTPWAGS